jgi:hypothetical protein
MRAGLDLGIDVRDYLLKDDVDLGAPFVPFTADLVQILAALLTEVSIPSIVVSDSRPSWTVPRSRRRPPPILFRCPRWVDGTTIF